MYLEQDSGAPQIKGVIVDVGANRGQSARFFRRLYPDLAIHSFEPLDKPFLVLNKLGIKNHYANKLAISNEIGQRIFYENIFEETSSFEIPNKKSKRNFIKRILLLSLKSELLYKEKVVTCSTLDHYCESLNLKDIHILKIDVEGHELSVLYGAKNLLSNKSIKTIQLETHKNDLRYDKSAEIQKYLNQFGYSFVARIKHPFDSIYEIIYRSRMQE